MWIRDGGRPKTITERRKRRPSGVRRWREERASERVEMATCENDRYPFPPTSAYGPVGCNEGGPLVIFERMTPRTRYIIMFAYILYISIYIYNVVSCAVLRWMFWGRDDLGVGAIWRNVLVGERVEEQFSTLYFIGIPRRMKLVCIGIIRERSVNGIMRIRIIFHARGPIYIIYTTVMLLLLYLYICDT